MTEIIEDRGGLMSVKLSVELLELLRRLRWFQSFTSKERLELGQVLKLRDSARLSPYVGLYSGDNIPEIGAFSYTSSKLDRMMSVGAYCSISWNVRVMGISHPMDCFSTTASLYQSHPIFEAAYADANLATRYHPNPQKSMPMIGNDVWIGQDVLLGRGITIGDGAVIAAGSVVVKSVLPYQVVGGAPARLIRYRFTEAERDLLQWSRWWEYHMPALMSGPVNDVRAFVSSLLTNVRNNKVLCLTPFSQSLAEIIRSGQVASFLASDGNAIFKTASPRDLTSMPGSDMQ